MIEFEPVERSGSDDLPLLSGPKSMLFWTMNETINAEQEAPAGGDYRQAA